MHVPTRVIRPSRRTTHLASSPLPTAFGTFHVPNISSDTRDGIGRWGEAQFIAAMRHGVSPSGQHLYPAFPYTSYQAMRTEDLRDLFAYLKTLPAVSGAAPDHALKFPFNIRRTVGLWKLLFLDEAPFKPDTSQSAQWNRGAYLVNAPGHCAECHSPRNLLGAIIANRRFTGGQSPTGQGGVPDLTQGKLRDWKVQDFVEVLFFLRRGHLPRRGGRIAQLLLGRIRLVGGLFLRRVVRGLFRGCWHGLLAPTLIERAERGDSTEK